MRKLGKVTVALGSSTSLWEAERKKDSRKHFGVEERIPINPLLDIPCANHDRRCAPKTWVINLRVLDFCRYIDACVRPRDDELGHRTCPFRASFLQTDIAPTQACEEEVLGI